MTKAAIVAVMRELDRPVSAEGLHGIWGKAKPLAAIDYHLATLVKAKVVEVVFGPELHFQLTPAERDTRVACRERCH